MKQRINQRMYHILLAALPLLVLGLTACDNEFHVGPTEPLFPPIVPNQGGLRTLDINGVLIADRGTCLKATILFNGQEISGARAQCASAGGCAELSLAGYVEAPVGDHTITFKVLRQAAEFEDYLASGHVQISRPSIDLGNPVSLTLKPTRASLQAGEGVSFEFRLSD